MHISSSAAYRSSACQPAQRPRPAEGSLLAPWDIRPPDSRMAFELPTPAVHRRVKAKASLRLFHHRIEWPYFSPSGCPCIPGGSRLSPSYYHEVVPACLRPIDGPRTHSDWPLDAALAAGSSLDGFPSLSCLELLLSLLCGLRFDEDAGKVVILALAAIVLLEMLPGLSCSPAAQTRLGSAACSRRG